MAGQSRHQGLEAVDHIASTVRKKGNINDYTQMPLSFLYNTGLQPRELYYPQGAQSLPQLTNHYLNSPNQNNLPQAMLRGLSHRSF